MKPMEAWSIISANLAHLVRIRRSQGDPKGYVPAETEAEVIAFKALREMQDRMYPKPLRMKDLMEMCGQPVWIEPVDKSWEGRWAIIEGCSEYDGEKYLFLEGDLTYCNYEKSVIAYRYKPAEVKEND